MLHSVILNGNIKNQLSLQIYYYKIVAGLLIHPQISQSFSLSNFTDNNGIVNLNNEVITGGSPSEVALVVTSGNSSTIIPELEYSIL